MRILVVLSRVPFPLEKGDKLRAFHQIKGLSVNHEIILCCLSDGSIDPRARQELEPFCSQVHFFKLSRVGIFFRLFAAFFSKLPFQVHYFKSPAVKQRIEEIAEQEHVGHVYCQLIRCSELVKDIKVPGKTIDYMDALSMGMVRRAEQSGGFKKWFFLTEAKRLDQYEHSAFEQFSGHCIISMADRDCISSRDTAGIKIIPNGVEMEYFSPQEVAPAFDLVFVGNLNYAPNIDCVLYLVNEVMPKIIEKRPNARLLIAGADPCSAVRALAERPYVDVKGWFEDIRDAYASAKIFAAPMRIGTGLQNKLLESLSMGIPTVTSSLANKALGAIPGEEIMVGDSADEVAAHCLALLIDEKKSLTMANAGRHLVKRSYSWEGSVKMLEKLFNDASLSSADD